MKRKPLFIVILSILCLLEPLFKASYLMVFDQLTSPHNWRELFEAWLVFPLAGLVIIRMRRWSYLAFLALMIHAIYTILYHDEYTNSFIYGDVIAFVSFGVLLFFLLPSIRRPFVDPTVRWWEPATRYRVHILCELLSPRGLLRTNILNISKTGVFLADLPSVRVGEKMLMDVIIFGEPHQFFLEVVNRHEIQGQRGLGAKLVFASWPQRWAFYGLIRQIADAQRAIDSKIAI